MVLVWHDLKSMSFALKGISEVCFYLELDDLILHVKGLHFGYFVQGQCG